MTALRGRAGIAGGALIIMALGGLAVPAATTTTPAMAVTTAPATGVDVSPFTTINSWSQVQAAGASFVGDEATFAKTAESTYAADAEAAVQAGLYVMPYAFVFPYDPSANGTVAQQAQAAVNVVNSVPGTAYEFNGHNMRLPLVVDIEPDPYYTSEGTTQCYGLTPTGLVSWLQTFIQDVSSVGTTPIIYTTASFWNTCTGNSTAFSGDPLWLASYGVTNPALPTGWNNYTFWQYTNSGTINGISGGTDLDYLGPVLQVSQAGKAIGPVRLRTLTSLTGQTDTYSPTSLPPGLAMSSTGTISGTPTTIGQFTASASTSTGAVPSSMTFTWDVHGTLTVNSPGTRATTAGTPVGLRITAADQDGSKYPPSFTPSGLPAGLSMNSSGLITGWPYKPGTYTVRVSASDGLYAAGSMSFTWTIGAAAGSGFTGVVRQVGGTGKCLDDPSGKTANGTLVQLWTCNGHTNQAWTVVQDGTIRVLGKCLAASGTSLVLWGCSSGTASQEWQAGSDGELVSIQSGKCLDVPVASAANGTRPTMATCANSPTQPNEHWLRAAANIYSGQPGKCMAVSGSTVELATCANVAAQHWIAAANGTFQLGGKCLTETGTAANSGLTLGACSTATALKWNLKSAGAIPTELANATSGLCVTAPSSAVGSPLRLGTCGTGPASTWHIE